MAKFSACYRLCPLIDQKSFLGVKDECVNGCVIITLGKNMVIRYKLSDQKQVSCWSSRDNFSAPVVYDTGSQKYIGIFNYNQLSIWDDACVQLNHMKKYKFAADIECVVVSTNFITPVVVFHTGHVLPLQQALDRRKETFLENSVLSKDEVISDSILTTLIGSVVVILFTKTSKGDHFLHLIPLEEGLLGHSCLQLRRKSEDSLKLIGHSIVSYESCQLLTLWSDGKLFSLELPIPDSDQFPGKMLTTLTMISKQYPAAILPLNPSHLAIYGADASEEGALLFIFNSQLCVTQCCHSFKLYTPPAQLWAGGSDCVLVVDGQYLVVVPYYLGKQRLAALLGSQDCDIRPLTVAKWGSEASVKEEPKAESSYLEKIIKDYMEEGMSQRMICQSLFYPTIDCQDVDGLISLMKIITDIPETCIVPVITFCLKNIEAPGYRGLLRTALALPVSPDLATVQLLRQHLDLTLVLKLLKELTEAMLVTPADPQLIEWATLLLDAYYQEYLLSRDETVTTTLTELKLIVDKQVEDMKVWQQLDPLLHQLMDSQQFPDSNHTTNTTYCIEQITLY